MIDRKINEKISFEDINLKPLEKLEIFYKEINDATKRIEAQLESLVISESMNECIKTAFDSRAQKNEKFAAEALSAIKKNLEKIGDLRFNTHTSLKLNKNTLQRITNCNDSLQDSQR